MSDARKLVKTSAKGIYKRLNAKGETTAYVVIYRAAGKQRREYADTLDAARKLKRERESARDSGEWQERTTITLRAYLSEWVESYGGNGKTTFRENTRREYRRLLDAHAHAYFGERLRLVDVTPKHLADWVAHLANPSKQGGKVLAASTMRNAVMPVRAALAEAKRTGLIRHNPCDGLVFPVREVNPDEVADEDEDRVKALDPDELSSLLALIHPRHRLMARLLAATGLRISEAIALQRKHLHLDGDAPRIDVRRAIVRGKVGLPKSKHGKRSVRLPLALADDLRTHLATLPDERDALVFATSNGTALDPDNLRARVLKPAAGEAGVKWVGWHTFRHTFASLQLARGTNLLQLSRALGHHSPAFTLDRYCSLLPGDEAPALDLPAIIAPRVSRAGAEVGAQATAAVAA